jgi:hypothetical protein
MQTYPFLVMCALMILPVLAVGVWRRDLICHMARMALVSLPFAFTEFMFYPDYWDPPFLFDAAARFGFGLEDFLFVASLGAMAIGLYPALAREQLQPFKMQAATRPVLKIIFVTALALLAALAGWGAGFPAIYTGLVIMFTIPAVLLRSARPDLWRHAWKSGCTSLIAYVGVCTALEILLPGTFARYWHTGDLLNAYAGPLPVEELLYGFAAGFAAAVIYPFAFCLEFRHYPTCTQRK